MKKVVINYMDDLDPFYNESEMTYVFPEDVGEIVFNDMLPLKLRPVKRISAPNADLHLESYYRAYFVNEETIVAKNLYAENLESNGDIIAFDIHAKELICNNILSFNIDAECLKVKKDITASFINVAEEISANRIKANSVKAKLLECNVKEISDTTEIDEYRKIITSAKDLKEFYDPLLESYIIPKNIKSISYYGKKPLKLSYPLCAEHTHLKIRKLIIEGDIVCLDLHGEYIKAENITAEFGIEVQVLRACRISCNTIKCGK